MSSVLGRDKIDAISYTKIFKCICFNGNAIKIPLKFVPKGPVNNVPALLQIMFRQQPGDKPLNEAMVVRFPMYIFVTRPR